MDHVAVLGCVGFALGGVSAGALGRRVLGRLRRGAVVRPPWCELAVAVLWAIVAARWFAGAAPDWWLPVPLLLSWLGVLLTVTDLAHRRLPDRLTLPAYPVAGVLLGIAAVLGPDPWLAARAVVGGLVFWGLHAAIHWSAPHALGRGDVKLSGSLGAVLGAAGPAALVFGAVLAALVTALLGASLVRRLATGDVARGIPHGPGLLLATWLVAVFPGAGLVGGGL
jgi:leader peptidase (prepilin peptidase)/N-methyltransferase